MNSELFKALLSFILGVLLGMAIMENPDRHRLFRAETNMGANK